MKLPDNSWSQNSSFILSELKCRGLHCAPDISLAIKVKKLLFHVKVQLSVNNDGGWHQHKDATFFFQSYCKNVRPVFLVLSLSLNSPAAAQKTLLLQSFSLTTVCQWRYRCRHPPSHSTPPAASSTESQIVTCHESVSPSTSGQ